MGIFGWSYPPGCSGPPDDEGPCEVCGLSVDYCICPECPICSEYGNPHCYDEPQNGGHFLRMTKEQIASKKEADDAYEEECRMEQEYFASIEKDLEW